MSSDKTIVLYAVVSFHCIVYFFAHSIPALHFNVELNENIFFQMGKTMEVLVMAFLCLTMKPFLLISILFVEN